MANTIMAAAIYWLLLHYWHCICINYLKLRNRTVIVKTAILAAVTIAASSISIHHHLEFLYTCL